MPVPTSSTTSPNASTSSGVVRTSVETGHSVGDGIAGGQQQNRHGQPFAPDAPADGEPVQAGQTDVQHEQIGDRSLERCQRCAAVIGAGDDVAVRHERALEHAADRPVVVDDEN
jgi:hypothetical protein